MKVYKYVEEDSTIPLEMILERAGVSADTYLKAFRYSLQGANIKREAIESRINNKKKIIRSIPTIQFPF